MSFFCIFNLKCRLFCIQNLHWTVDNEGHHDVHVSDVLLKVWIWQVQLCAPVSNIKT